jgi:hypothetical protein
MQPAKETAPTRPLQDFLRVVSTLPLSTQGIETTEEDLEAWIAGEKLVPHKVLWSILQTAATTKNAMLAVNLLSMPIEDAIGPILFRRHRREFKQYKEKTLGEYVLRENLMRILEILRQLPYVSQLITLEETEKIFSLLTEGKPVS